MTWIFSLSNGQGTVKPLLSLQYPALGHRHDVPSSRCPVLFGGGGHATPGVQHSGGGCTALVLSFEFSLEPTRSGCELKPRPALLNPARCGFTS